MSSTDDKRIARLFEDVSAAAAKLRERGVRFFPLGPEPDADSWYEPAPSGPDFFALEPDVRSADRLYATSTSALCR